MTISKNKRWLMFNQIAKTYDLINRLITFGRDIQWRNQMVAYVPDSAVALLDIASGTMDVAITAAKHKPNLNHIIALDMAENMLDIGLRKCDEKNITNIQKKVADIHQLPYSNQEFDAATVSFGIRNFENLDQAFTETHRVLKPNGVFVILESCQPANGIIRFLNGVFLNTWVRLIGILFSGHGDSYGYLAKSIQTFHTPDDLKRKLTKVGFTHVECRFFMFQSVQLIYAIK
ncbi:MAG: ubiquinone/menaquinone biosynthesis methyltransferase [Candidatus Margulisiibacteriota bacterium]